MEKYKSVAEATQDATVLAQADEKYQATINDLAKDSGTDGSTTIMLASQMACNGEVVTDPSVDIFPDEKGKALPCMYVSEDFVDYELLADIPGTFRYVV